MGRSEILCWLCAHPYALDYRRSRAGPPKHIHGAIAVECLFCTRCGSPIPQGRGYVIVDNERDTAIPNRADDRRPSCRDRRQRLVGLTMEIITSLLGIVLAVAPLALWVAPTVPVFLMVLCTTMSAVLGLYVLDVCRGETALARRLLQHRRPVALSDGFLVELLKLLPLTHHNRRPGDPEFQRKMDRLKQHLTT